MQVFTKSLNQFRIVAFHFQIMELVLTRNTKDKYEGSGIGLTITKKILDKHNDSINANSKEGIGSEFVITLPFRPNTRNQIID